MSEVRAATKGVSRSGWEEHGVVGAGMRRREFLAAGAAASAGVMLFGRAGRAFGDGPGGSCIWGIGDTYTLDSNFGSYCDGLEAELGRGFAGFRLSGGFSSRRDADFVEMHRMVSDGRRWTYVNGKPSGTVTGYWKAIVSGQYDVALNQFIHTVQTDPTWSPSQPLHFSFHHEQYVKAEGGGFAAGTAQDFIAAFRHVRWLVDQSGAHVNNGGNILMCWTPHWRQFYHDPIVGVGGGTASVRPYVVSVCDPGAEYYDMLGVDMYNQSQYTFSATGQWTPVYRYSSMVGRPFFSPETGIAGTDTKVVTYLQEMDSLLKGWGAGLGSGQIAAVCWTSRIAKYSDFRLDATPARLAQYTTMANDPFYSLIV
jgi:hypothetical protein